MPVCLPNSPARGDSGPPVRHHHALAGSPSHNLSGYVKPGSMGETSLMGHFEEKQIGKLLYIVAIGHAVVTQDVAVVPETLDDGLGCCVHRFLHMRDCRAPVA